MSITQVVGFATRASHGMVVNQALGILIALLAIPATVVLIGDARAGSPWWIGLAVFDALVVLMVVVDNWWPVESRQPARPVILIPYLLIFFGSILLMGLSMYRVNRRLTQASPPRSADVVRGDLDRCVRGDRSRSLLRDHLAMPIGRSRATCPLAGDMARSAPRSTGQRAYP